jgi:hypothetical protein
MPKLKKRIRGKAPATLRARHEAKAEAAAATAAKKTTKVQQVIALCERDAGCSLADIVENLKVSKQAAASLLGDIRPKGIGLTREERDGLSVWQI